MHLTLFFPFRNTRIDFCTETYLNVSLWNTEKSLFLWKNSKDSRLMNQIPVCAITDGISTNTRIKVAMTTMASRTKPVIKASPPCGVLVIRETQLFPKELQEERSLPSALTQPLHIQLKLTSLLCCWSALKLVFLWVDTSKTAREAKTPSCSNTHRHQRQITKEIA